MPCIVCQNLKAAFDGRRRAYIEASASASGQACHQFVAYLNVELERAKAELEEHRLMCLSAANESLAAMSMAAGRASKGDMSSSMVGSAA